MGTKRENYSVLKTVGINLIIVLFVWGLLELGAFILYKFHFEKMMNYSLASRYEKEPVIFHKKVIDGKEMLISDIFPTRYYTKDTERLQNKINAKKTNQTIRIFTYGGSSTAGSPFGSWGSFSRFLEDQLKKIARPDVRIEIMNFGVGGFGSTRVARLVERTMEYSPDLVIVYSGHNEYCDNVPLLIAENTDDQNINKIRKFLETNSMVYRILQLSLGKAKMPKEPFRSPVCKMRTLTENQKKQYAENYESNIKRIIEFANRAGATVVLMSQFSNMVMPPFVEDAVKNKSNDAYTNFQLGLTELREGENDKAYAHLISAIDNDDGPQRFRSDYKQILIKSSRENKNVYFVDTADFVMKYAENKIIDGRFVIDIVHPNLTANKLISESLMKEFFNVYLWKSDYLNYEAYNPDYIWKQNISSTEYFRICERYFDIPEDDQRGQKCLAQVRLDFKNAKTEDQRRCALRSWEFLYVLGVETKNKELLKEAKETLNLPHLWNRLEAQ
jgi:hypothetical protein